MRGATGISCMRIGQVGAILVALLAAAPARAYDPTNGDWTRSDPRHVRVMSWNILKGVGAGVDTNPASPTEFGSAYDYIGRICQGMDPDIIAFQEVQDGAAVTVLAGLQAWADQFFGAGTFVVFIGEGDGFNRNAILSRYPFIDLTGLGATRINMPSIFAGPGGIPPGGDGGLRGWPHAGIDLPDAIYLGDMLVSSSHLKAFGGASDLQQRLEAGQNISYYINFGLNSATDPFGIIPGGGPTALSPTTPFILMGDMNEDEDFNFRDGPVMWLSEWMPAVANDGTDKDGTASRPDLATDPFSGSRDTQGGQNNRKLDYVIVQDSIVTVVEEFIFDSAQAANDLPPQLVGLLGASSASAFASDHRPVILDLLVPQLDGDFDGDGVQDSLDNCVFVANSNQLDSDGDNLGDACDGCPNDANKDDPGECGCGVAETDTDGDGVPDCNDICPNGDDIADTDGDNIPDGCDDCTDPDSDGIGNAGLDTSGCPIGGEDNCPQDPNPDQLDCDGDGTGDACDLQGDSDRDGTCNAEDNCLFIANPGQEDVDGDGLGDVCDTDADADGFQGTAAGGDGQDCNDLDAAINPVAQESPAAGNCLDSADNDCDGFADASDPDCAGCQFPCGDLDGTGDVNLLDFASFAVCFGSTPSLSPECECADLNKNDAINLTDFATFGLVFGKAATTNFPPDCQ